MPRKIDPKNKLKTGTGLAGNDSIEANAFPDTDPNMAVGVGLEAHINDPVDAHPASAISYENEPIYFGDNVEEVLDELGGLVPPRPPTLGNWKTYLNFVGIPDWGVLKLSDDDKVGFGFIHPENNGFSVYPYYLSTETKNWTDLPPDEERGADLVSDSVFNVMNVPYTGGGNGFQGSHAGGYARGTEIIESFNVVKQIDTHCVISGSLFPADRGTLALLHLPAQSTLADIECIAALNCGQGIEDGCDGETGGIWNYGVGDDPYQYPSAASGQYDLKELHTGYETGSIMMIGSIEPHPTDPSLAHIIVSAPPILLSIEAGDKIFVQGSNSTPNIDGEHELVAIGFDRYTIVATITVDGNTGSVGIPLEPSDFDPTNADNTAGQVREEYTILGGTLSSVIPNKGVDSRDDNNFFRYRLPYLENYAELLWTPPSAVDRYYKKPTVSLNPTDDLELAGNYTNFNKDYWTFQIARYRHRFIINDDPTTREKGSYFIIHFKKEEYFENLMIDKVAPTSDQVYSANIVDWTDLESKDNVYDDSTSVIRPSASYDILKSRIFADDDGESATIDPITPYTLTRAIDSVIYVSGVRYFLSDGVFGMDNVTFTVNNLFSNSFRMGGYDVTKQSEGFRMARPTHYYTGQFSRRMTITANHGEDANNRIEIPYDLLGGFDLANAPLPADVATYVSPSTIIFDTSSQPVFSSDARPVVHVRQPVKHYNSNYVISLDGAEQSGKKIMTHSTNGIQYTDANPTYNNMKDFKEDFLDESYRWISDLNSPPALTPDEIERILGAGLPTVGAIDIPVRLTDASWLVTSFMEEGRHLVSLAGTEEAQFAGLPFLNPPMIEAVTNPAPVCGVLLYPQYNYGSGHRPSQIDGDISSAQPDYSGETGDKIFIRAFDACFSKSGKIDDAIGSSFFKLRIHGLELEDFAWSGGASSGGLGIAILVKVAGLTTWMDIGRVDGSGASKQDAFSDGAGCQINDPTETKDGVSTDTGIVYADVLVHTGGAAPLYENSEAEAPILVKVILKDSAEGRALDMTTPNLMGKCRGLCGIELLRPE